MIGIGHIGAGKMAMARAQSFLKRKDVRIVAGWSRSEARIKDYERITGARGTRVWKEVVENPDVNAVCVGTPTNTHADFAITAINAGRHVLLESPAVGNISELDSMAQVAERNKVVLYVGSNYRFDAPARAVRYATENLGDVRLALGDSSWLPDERSWFYDKALSGGLFPCVHLYQIALFHCLGRAQWVEATFGKDELYGAAKLKYENGAIGIATGGFQLHGSNRFVVAGSEGIMRQSSDGQFVIQRGGDMEPVRLDDVNSTDEDNACFFRCIRGEDDWRIQFARERAVHAIVISAQQSAETGRRINI